MSADNTIAIFELTDYKYRVAHVQNVEDWANISENQDDKEMLWEFNNFPLFDTYKDALEYATKLLNDIEYVEYGICTFSVNIGSELY